jgi:hypothetical protein
MAEGDVDVDAAVLVSPVVQLRRVVDMLGRQFGLEYAWSDASNAVADRLDFVARAPEIARPAILLVVGEEDDPAVLEPAAALSRSGDRAELVTVPDMAHELADEPGTEPEPQTPQAVAVDRHAVQWFERRLG